MNTLKEWQHLEFAEIISCTRCTLATAKNFLRDDGENVPQPGYIGPHYRKSRVLLVGRNPASANERLAASDRKYTAAMGMLRDDPTVERYWELNAVLKEFMPKWPYLKPYLPLLTECGLSLDDIAYCNVVCCRTSDGEAPGDLVAKQCLETHFVRWVERLEPKVIVFLGKWAWKQARTTVAAKGIPCDYMNRSQSLSADERAKNEKKVVELLRKHRGDAPILEHPATIHVKTVLKSKPAGGKGKEVIDTPYTSFMRDLEHRFQSVTGLANRSNYKIYYGQIRQAPILTLGINPGGDPAQTSEDGRTHTSGVPASASAAYFENDEHDVLDCEWKENDGLRKLLLPLVDGARERIRHEVVKTNLAFRRSAKATHIQVERSFDETAPFLSEILAKVGPKLILLTGPKIAAFASRYASAEEVLFQPEREPRVKQIIFAASRVRLRATGSEALVVQVAHASQFGWTYDRYEIPQRISALMERQPGAQPGRA